MEKTFDIIIENVTKKYSKCTNDLERLLTIFGISRKGTITVFENLSFKIKKGEKIALIGKNGSGKTTLLKIISNITIPNSGKVIVNRRISTLLEVNAGFNLEFSAIENLYTRCILLGLKNKEIKAIEDKIFEFAGISNDFKKQQLKKFSIGMIAKLGFAINLFSYPEILIIDEALAVGDIEFKNKCEKELQKLSKKDDVTLLFVSHDQKMVEEFCDRGILIDQGKIILDDQINKVFKVYNNLTKI